jgi:hypothetical protein
MTTKGLRLGPGVTLPLDAVTETCAILAKRGAGKTYTASILAEEMLAAELQVVIVDPMSAWWGLRASADGKREGFPIAVLGGPRGDVPLESTGGQVVAELVVGERISAILDVSDFSKSERRRFVTDFLERLYQKNREPLHVFLEEADLFAPQTGGRGQEENARMLGASYDIVRRGRGRGIGSTLITQRSASISKEVLEQAEILVALRTTGPRDRKAIEGWIDVHGEEDEQDTVMASLPGLPTGTAWVWWPVEGMLKRVKIRKRTTFDSSATPKVGVQPRRPKTVAEVDLRALHTQMKDTIERAKAEDPKELRKEIATLKRQIQERPAEVEERVEQVPVEVPIFKDGEVARLEKAVNRMADVGDKLVVVGRAVGEAAQHVGQIVYEAAKKPPLVHTPTPPRRPARVTSTREGVVTKAPIITPGDVTLNRAERRILQVLAQYPDGRTKRQVAVLTGYAIRGGGFNNALSRLRSLTYIEGRDTLTITQVGMDAVENWEPLPTGPALLDYWLGQLPKAERAILEVLTQEYPRSLSKEDVAERAGYEVRGGGFNNAVSRLRTLELIDGRGELRASDDLF